MSEFDIEKFAQQAAHRYSRKKNWAESEKAFLAFGRRCQDYALERAAKLFPCKRGCSCELDYVRKKIISLKSDGGK